MGFLTRLGRRCKTFGRMSIHKIYRTKPWLRPSAEPSSSALGTRRSTSPKSEEFTKPKADRLENTLAEKQFIPDECGVKCIPTCGPADKWQALHPHDSLDVSPPYSCLPINPNFSVKINKIKYLAKRRPLLVSSLLLIMIIFHHQPLSNASFENFFCPSSSALWSKLMFIFSNSQATKL